MKMIDSIRMEELRAALAEIGVEMRPVGVSNLREFAYGDLRWRQREYGGAFYASCEALGNGAEYALERSAGGWISRLSREDDSGRAVDMVTLNPVEALNHAAGREDNLRRIASEGVAADDGAVSAMIAKDFDALVSVRRLKKRGEYALHSLFRHDDGDHFVAHLRLGDNRRWTLTDDGDCEWHYVAMGQGGAAFGRAQAETITAETARIQTEFMWPDNDLVDVVIESLDDGWYLISDGGQAYEYLSMNGMDSSDDKASGYFSQSAHDALVGLMGEVIKHGCGLELAVSVIRCRVRAEDLGAGVAAVVGSALEVAALVYPWRAGLLRGGGLPDIAGKRGEGRRFAAALTGEDVRRRMDEMGVALAEGSDMTAVLDAVQRALDYGECAGGAAAYRDRALDELLEQGVLRAKASSGCE